MTTIFDTAELNELISSKSFEIINYVPKNAKSENEDQVVAEGLKRERKRISSKYFYDKAGSKLFDRICELPEYYPTKAELEILQTYANEIVHLQDFKNLVELGSGSDQKINRLLKGLSEDELKNLSYVPVDISASAIEEAYQGLSQKYPQLKVLGIVNDFTHELALPQNAEPRLICFLGGTIGNFEDEEAVHFLQNVYKSLGENDRFLLGFDLVKDVSVMEAAYNDSQGVTEAFNKNILKVLNAKYNADFSLNDFKHKAFFNSDKSRIEMHIEALKETKVTLQKLDLTIFFHKGETIHTENSRKFTLSQMCNIAEQAGLKAETHYTDSNVWFAEMVFRK